MLTLLYEKKDDVIDMIPEKDGVIMINFSPDFISCSPNATIYQVADHIQYVRDKIGAKYVGLGSDFDGIQTVPVGLEDVSKYPDLIAELISRNFTDDEIRGIASENMLRILGMNYAFKYRFSYKFTNANIPIIRQSRKGCFRIAKYSCHRRQISLSKNMLIDLFNYILSLNHQDMSVLSSELLQNKLWDALNATEYTIPR